MESITSNLLFVIFSESIAYKFTSIAVSAILMLIYGMENGSRREKPKWNKATKKKPKLNNERRVKRIDDTNKCRVCAIPLQMKCEHRCLCALFFPLLVFHSFICSSFLLRSSFFVTTVWALHVIYSLPLLVLSFFLILISHSHWESEKWKTYQTYRGTFCDARFAYFSFIIQHVRILDSMYVCVVSN